MGRRIAWLTVAALMIAAPIAVFAEGEKQENQAAEKRAEIDKTAKMALEDVLAKSETAPALYEKAYGWAVFDNLRITFLVTGGGGAGVAVNKKSGARTYMKMGTGGLSLGIGAQKYQVVMFFEDEKTFTRFIEKGWKAETSATAAAGTAGAGAGTNFINGIAYYQLTEAGLMASADISGTKYVVDKELNAK